MLICMLARERSQIIRVFCHNLLSFLLQVLAEFYLGISTVRNARNDLMAGETVLALIRFAIQSEDKLLAVGRDDGLGWKGDAPGHVYGLNATCFKRLRIYFNMNSNRFGIIVKVLV